MAHEPESRGVGRFGIEPQRVVLGLSGVLVSGCAGSPVVPDPDAALRGIERESPTPREQEAAAIWLCEVLSPHCVLFFVSS